MESKIFPIILSCILAIAAGILLILIFAESPEERYNTREIQQIREK